ncbi:MAG: rhodanese-like domain-containing protein [Bacteroidetes bacterium]|nr:rhodanese-like domain-containing protein [Bacteroidota bacterium]
MRAGRITWLIVLSWFLVFDSLSAQNAMYSAFLNTLYQKFNVVHIHADSLADLMAKERLVLLDTRSKEEFAVSHLKDARLVAYDSFEAARIVSIDKATPIIVYCSVGYRSSVVAEKLIAAGYTNVRNLYGGIFAWVNDSLPVYKDGQVTEDVHPYDAYWGIWLTKGRKTEK